MTPPGPAPAKLEFLDGMRGLAALYVLLGHARWLLWEGHAGMLAHPERYTWPSRGLAYASACVRYGHEVVLFFFVLSGYVIHLRYAAALAQGAGAARFDLAPFLGRRCRRLYPPLVFAMLVTLLVDGLGRMWGWGIYSGQTPYPLINANVPGSLDAKTALGNLAFLMATYAPVYGTNGPLWTLRSEFWFYALYPLCWYGARKSPWWATAGVAGTFAVACVGHGWPVKLLQDVFSGMLIWWLGALLAEDSAGRVRVPTAALALLAAGAMCIMPFCAAQALHDLAVGSAFAAILGLMLRGAERGARYEPLRRLRWLGHMSYTLYVSHFPLLVFMSGWVMSRTRGHELPSHMGWACCGVILAMLVAWGAHFVVELPFTSKGRARNAS